MDFRNFSLFSLLPCLLLYSKLVFKLFLLFSEFLLNLLQEAWLIQIELFRLLAGHHELLRVAVKTIFLELQHWLHLGLLHELGMLLLVARQSGVVSVVQSLVHQISNFWTELLPFLVPTPLVDLSLTQARFLGDLQKSLFRPVWVFFKFAHESPELLRTLSLSLPHDPLILTTFSDNVLCITKYLSSIWVCLSTGRSLLLFLALLPSFWRVFFLLPWIDLIILFLLLELFHGHYFALVHLHFLLVVELLLMLVVGHLLLLRRVAESLPSKLRSTKHLLLKQWLLVPARST